MWIGPCNHQVGSLVNLHKLVPFPMFPLHSAAWGKGPGKKSKRYSANFSARLAKSREWSVTYVYCAKNSTDVNEAGYLNVKSALMLFRPLPGVGMQNFGMFGIYNLAKAYRNVQIYCQSSQRLESRQCSHLRYDSTVSWYLAWLCGWTYMCAAI